jgi:hypothetical protein
MDGIFPRPMPHKTGVVDWKNNFRPEPGGQIRSRGDSPKVVFDEGGRSSIMSRPMSERNFKASI